MLKTLKSKLFKSKPQPKDYTYAILNPLLLRYGLGVPTESGETFISREVFIIEPVSKDLVSLIDPFSMRSLAKVSEGCLIYVPFWRAIELIQENNTIK